MKLNCNKGDWAVVVQSKLGNLGKIVKCVRAGVAGEIVKLPNGREVQTSNYKECPFWITDVPLVRLSENGERYMSNVFPDFSLRPLRDSDEPDETLTWAGKPQEVKV